MTPVIKKKQSFHLIATTHNREIEVLRLIESLDKQNSFHEINLYVLCQDNDFFNSNKKSYNNLKVHYFFVDRRLSLSEARNYVLQRIMPLEDDAIVGFPDDDCWYDPLTMDSIADKFIKYPDISYLSTSVFDPINNSPYGKRPNYDKLYLEKSDLFLLPISVGIFIRYSAFISSGPYFNESLGIGTNLGSGEETELIYRLMSNGFNGSYFGSIRVFHLIERPEDRSFKKSFNYGKGFGYLNAIIAKKGDFSQITFLSRILFTSILGILYLPIDTRKSNSYFGRLYGTIHGFISGMTSGGLKNNEKS